MLSLTLDRKISQSVGMISNIPSHLEFLNPHSLSMDPLSLRPTRNLDPSIKSNSSPHLVDSASCATLESIHCSGFFLPHPCQDMSVGHFSPGLLSHAWPGPCLFLLPLFPTSYSTLQNNYIKGLLRCYVPLPCVMQVTGQTVLSAQALFHNVSHCLANSAYSSGHSLDATSSGKFFLRP